MQRAVLWLRANAEGTLIKNGDVFELPDFPVSRIDPVFAFQEDCVSMMIWEDTDKRYGIKSFAPKARDGLPHLLLIGFPIPARVGEAPYEMTWQAIELPVLSHGQYTNQGFHSGKRHNIPRTQGAAKGYRPGEAGWWMNDKATIFLDSMELSWISSENWSARTIKGRGKLANRLTNQRIAMIGLGSLGASIAELLIRAGVAHLTCVDGNALEIGNLCRHTLCLPDLYQANSKHIAERLTNIDPNTRITYEDSYLSVDESGALVPDLNDYDIIIDTTGEDQVLALLSTTKWKRNTVFCSSSVGLGANRLYINIQRTDLPCFEDFLNLEKPYFQKDYDDCDLDDLPRDGIGCWHPLLDDIWFAACTTVKALESFFEHSSEKGISLIYATKSEDGLFAGLRLIEKQYEHE